MNGDHTQASTSSWSLDLPLTDALPYFDDELDTKPGLRSKVDREIQAEMAKGGASLADNDPRLPPRSLRAAQNGAISTDDESGAGVKNAIDVSRYQLLAPAHGMDASEEEWEAAVKNAASQLMHQEGRLLNLELLKRYGANSWRLHNYQQENALAQYCKAQEALAAKTTSLNRRRRQQQSEAGQHLTNLERKWTELISRGLQLEVANITAEHEVQALEMEEQDLAAQLAALE
ncbi:unnamed protein product [Jaminaea pallidilutea]